MSNKARYPALWIYATDHGKEWIAEILKWSDDPDYGDSVETEDDEIKAVKEAKELLAVDDIDIAVRRDLVLFISDFEQVEGTIE